MNAIFWVLMVGVAGWLTGRMFGEEGYGKVLRGGYAEGLDIVLGIVGASIGGYLFFWTLLGEGSSLGSIATAILGSIILVGVARMMSTRYMLSGVR